MRDGSYRPPRQGRYQPTGQMRKATSASMRKMADAMQERHPDLGAHEHIRDAAKALDRNDPRAATRHLSAAVGNMTPQSLRRHGLLTDEQHDSAKRSMDAVHRHILLVKDIEDMQARNNQLPHAVDEDPANAPGIGDSGLDEKPTARQPGGDKALNAPASTPVGRIDINVSKPQQVTNPKAAHQIAASNGDLTTVIELDWATWDAKHGVNWKSGSATEAVAKGMGQRGTPKSEMPHLPPKAKQAYDKLRAKGHSHEHAMRAVHALGKLGGAIGKATGAGEATDTLLKYANDGGAVELVGPKGFVHGWIKVGGDGAASLHGKQVDAVNLSGKRVGGTYNHATKTVNGEKVQSVRAKMPSARVPKPPHPPGGAPKSADKQFYQGERDASGGMRFAVEMSADTARLAVTPAPRGKPGGPGLYGVKGNMHSPYFQQVVKALIEKRGMPPEKAYPIAWAALRKWEAKSKHPEVRAAAAGGLALEKVAEARAK